MDGFETISSGRQNLKRIDKDFVGDVLLRFHGGVGDVLIGVGGCLYGINDACRVSAGVPKWQVPLVSQIVGIDEVVTYEESCSVSFCSRFDAVIDFHLVNTKQRDSGFLPARDYYDIMSDICGVPASPAKFNFETAPELVNDRKVVALHPSASTPNRRWLNERWDELVSRLVGSGFHVVWLGTADEYGFNSDHVVKLSDLDSDLVWQSTQLAKSHYFIGCDSGFAHIAGMLGIRGTVIFTVTSAKHVISRYPSLSGTDVFDKLGVEPSRRLIADDPDAKKVVDSISAKMVLDSLGVDANVCIDVNKKDSIPYRVKVINKEGDDGTALVNFIGSICEIISDDSKIKPDATVIIEDAPIDTKSDRIELKSHIFDGGKGLIFSPHEPPSVVRQILRQQICS
jgi:hypothetical protein